MIVQQIFSRIDRKTTPNLRMKARILTIETV